MSRWALLLLPASFSVWLVTACVGDDPEGSPNVDSGAPDTGSGTPDTGSSSGGDTGSSTDAPIAECDPTKPFGAPEKTLFNAINTSAREESPYLTPDELTMYFTSDRLNANAVVTFDIFRSTRAKIGDPFGVPEAVKGGVNSDKEELGSIVAEDEKTMFFIGVGGGYEIFSSTRATTTADWGPATLVGGGVNGSGTNEYPDEFRNGDLWFHRDDGSLRRLPKSGNGFGAEEAAAPELGKIGTFRLSHDGTRAFFGKDEPDAGANIWTATRTGPGAPFTGIEKVPNVNSPSGDYVSWVSLDGCRLYLASDRDGKNDIFIAVRPR